MGRFANTQCRGARIHSTQPQNEVSAPHRKVRGPIRRLLGCGQPSKTSPTSLESPPITTKINPDGTVTGSLTLPKGMDPSSITFRTSTTHNGNSMDYTVRLSRGKTSSEFYDTRNRKNFCKMSAVKNQDGTHSISFTLYEHATKASLYMPGYTTQSFSRVSAQARADLAAIETPSAIAQEFTCSPNPDGSITGILHLTPEQARAQINFRVSKKTDTSRLSINSSLSSNDLSARVEGMYDVRRTITADGGAILSMTLPPGQVRGKVSIGGDSFVLSSNTPTSSQHSPPVAAEPIASEPITSEPVAPEPVAPEPIASEPVASEPVVENPQIVPSTTTNQSSPAITQNSNLSFLRSYAERLSAETKSILTPIEDTELSNIDGSRSAVGLEHPAGLDRSHSKIREYLFLRSNSSDNSASVLRVIQRDPPIFSRDESSYLQSIAVQTYSLNTQNDASISFNNVVTLPEPVSIGDEVYSHGEVRSDGSVILASSANADAELVVVRPGINPDNSITWNFETVYRGADGSINRSQKTDGTDTASTSQDEITSPSDRLPEQVTEEVKNKTDLNRDYLNSWVPTGPESGVFPVPEGAQIDLSSGPTGLNHPVGVHLDGQYRVLRTIKDPSQGKIPVVFKFTPSEDSDSSVEKIVALALQGHVLHDNMLRFNTTKTVSGDLPSNLQAYKFSQVRSDGSVLFSRHGDITQAGADLHIAAPKFDQDRLLKGWNWISVELQPDGSLTRKQY